MRRSVSGDMPTTKEVESKEVMVRQVPLMEMLSPRCASETMVAQEMVREVPPVASWGSSSVTAIGKLGVRLFEWVQIGYWRGGSEAREGAYCLFLRQCR